MIHWFKQGVIHHVFSVQPSYGRFRYLNTSNIFFNHAHAGRFRPKPLINVFLVPWLVPPRHLMTQLLCLGLCSPSSWWHSFCTLVYGAPAADDAVRAVHLSQVLRQTDALHVIGFHGSVLHIERSQGVTDHLRQCRHGIELTINFRSGDLNSRRINRSSKKYTSLSWKIVDVLNLL